MKPLIFEKYEAAQPRVERNGYATGNAARFFKFVTSKAALGLPTPRH
jgi:hypothetical protein